MRSACETKRVGYACALRVELTEHGCLWDPFLLRWCAEIYKHGKDSYLVLISCHGRSYCHYLALTSDSRCSRKTNLKGY